MKRTLYVSLSEFLHILAQFVNFVFWGAFFGARAGMDAYLTSVALPMVLGTVTVGPLISSLVPLLVEAKEGGPPEALARFQSNLLNIFAAGSVVLALLLMATSEWLIALIAPGLGPERRHLASSLLRIEALSIPLSIASGVLTSFHYAEEKYVWPTLVPVFSASASIALLVSFHRSLGIHVLAWGMVLAALVQVFLLLRIIRGHAWEMNWRDQRIKKLARRMLPLTGGNIYYKSDSLVDRFILSFLPVGSISYLGYGQRVVASLSQVLTRGLVTTRFTDLSIRNIRGREEFNEGLRRLFSQVCFFVAPVAVLLALFTRPLLHIILERGAFTALDVERTSAVVIAFLGLLVGGLLGSVLSGTFYAMGDTRTIAWIGVSVFTVGVALKVVGVMAFSYVGVALATSLYFFLAVIVEMVVLQKRLRVFSWGKTGVPVAKVVFASLGAFLAGLLWRKAFSGLWALAAGGMIVLAVYAFLALLTGAVDRSVWAGFAARFWKRRQK
ncbi:MAG: polysaccharide biosynthesis C-terminal domain-containing protein [Candidatus Aminicenantes bacterium]|nr:polysaccharide biosynthesis C-terminal domain-containing protein [Candidatus Aminicenantes bacterium]